ncbi:hypothetical protein LA52FAK_17730 [Desulforhopalus sp. 52FAK]
MQLTLAMIIIVSTISLATSFTIYRVLSIQSEKAFIEKTEGLFNRIQEDVVLPLWNMNYPLVAKISDSFLDYDEITMVWLKDHKGRTVYHFERQLTSDEVVSTANIGHEKELVGSLTVGFTPRYYKAENFKLLTATLITVFFLILGLSLSTQVVVQRLLAKPISSLISRIQKLKNNQYEADTTEDDYPEIMSILENFNEMAKEVKNREKLLKLEAMERKLQQDRYRLLADNTEDVIWTLDMEKRTTYVSPSIMQLRGLTPEEGVEQPLEEKILPEYLKMFTDLLDQAVTSGKPAIIEMEQFRKDRSSVWVESNIKPIYDDRRKPIGFIGVSRDISFRREAEAKQKALEQQLFQSQKMEAMGILASGIAHDFNNILSGILGFSELLKNDLDQIEQAGKMKRWVDIVLTCGIRAKDLVAQILAFTRQENETIAPINPATIVKEVGKLIKATLPSTIKVEVACYSKALVLTDAVKIHQIVMNLCTNAAYAMRETGGTLYLGLEDIQPQTTPIEQDNSRESFVRLRVSDTGPGIDEKTRDQILDPLFTTKPEGEGTGLGLSVVNDIVTDMGGSITINSSKGQGATFDIYLPVYQSSLGLGETVDSLDSILVTGKGNIIYIDDEKTMTQLATELLTSLSYKVTAFNSSVEALSHFRTHSEEYDLVMTDLTMPELTGDQLCQQIRKIRPDIPAILVTGILEDEPNQKFEIFDAVLRKPVRIGKMAKTIQNVFDAREGQ